jgi:Fic family protein
MKYNSCGIIISGGAHFMTYEEIIKRWQQNPILDAADIDLKLHNFRILFAYHSGKIENDEIDYHDTREIFENGKVSNYTGDVRTLFEQKNQKDCYEMLKTWIVQRTPLSIELIKKIHFELSKGTYDESRFAKGERPGEFKKNDYVVGFLDVGSEAMDVEADLLEILEEINVYRGDKILKVASYLHAGFENIHPFADGNGRVGRTIMNYYLIINNHPPVTIFEEDRKEYYKALEKFDRNEELDDLITFLLYQAEKTWNKR